VVQQIREALKAHNLVTIPDFNETWVDATTNIERPAKQAQNIEPEGIASEEAFGTPKIDQAPFEETETPMKPISLIDVQFSIGKLRAAGAGVTSVNPNALIQEALTIMLLHVSIT
jgi:hypothetical protein